MGKVCKKMGLPRCSRLGATGFPGVMLCKRWEVCRRGREDLIDGSLPWLIVETEGGW